MAVTLTVVQLRDALRLGASTTEMAEATRLLAYATAAVTKHAPDAPDAVQDEAVIRLAAYLFDQPTAGRYTGHANALRNSGAASILLPYRVHRAGSTAGAAAAASTTTPSGPGDDDVARRAAAAALAAAEAAQGTANEAIEDIAELVPLVAANANHAAATNREADAATETGLRSWSAALIRRVVEAVVPAWARQASPPSGTAGSIADGAVTTAKLADAAVTTAKLAGRAVTQAKIGLQAVGARELATDSVRTGHIADNAVTSAKIPSDEILSRHIAADQVTEGEMAANSVGTPELKDGNVTEAKLDSGVRTKLNRTGGTPTLSQMQQLGLVKFTPDPPVFVYSQASEFARTFRVRVDGPENLTGDIWYSTDIAGLNADSNVRTKWTGTTFVIDIAVPSNRATAVEAAADPDGMLLEVEFWNAAREGAVVEAVRVYVGVVKRAAAALGDPVQVGRAVSPSQSAAFRWVATGLTIPDDGLLEVLYLTANTVDTLDCSARVLRARTASSAGQGLGADTAVQFAIRENHRAFLGRTRANELLVASSGTGSDWLSSLELWRWP